MNKVFISGSIKIKRLDKGVIDRLRNILDTNLCILIGDADGVDSCVQCFLKEHRAESVVVYCSGSKPRNNLGHWAVKQVAAKGRPGTREFFTAKDISMAKDCDYGFMVWDAQSTGTLSNALELVLRRKPALVFVNTTKTFHTLKKREDFDTLLSIMTEPARRQACQKIESLAQLSKQHFAPADLFTGTTSGANENDTPGSPRRPVEKVSRPREILEEVKA
jgi:hypothetical protein